MDKTTSTKYTHRLLARFVIEAVTPLAVGSGEKDMITDSLVATDVNGLPYIPGTAIAGVLRGMVGKENDKIFGFQGNDSGKGSEIIFSEAKILNHEGRVIDGLDESAIRKDDLLRHYQILPIRQHVRISDKGVNETAGKFDEQVVYAGTRFCFEVEMVSDGNNDNLFADVLSQLNNKNFRIGSGTRCGFGEIKVVGLKVMKLNLKKETDLNLYLEKPSALNSDFWNKHADKLNIEISKLISSDANNHNNRDLITYTLTVSPESFFLFGSGIGDDEADMTPVKASRVVWKDNNGELKGEIRGNLVLIPATSVKGALAHRVAFHWNRLNGVFTDDLGSDADRKKNVGKNNIAVKMLFGSEGDSDEKDMTRGNVFISDVIKEVELPDKLFNHVVIDRFTGGTIEGGLFSEKVSYGENQEFTLTITIDSARLKEACIAADADFDKVSEALRCALQDICTGLLPLGGRVNHGLGVFSGNLTEEKSYTK